VEAKKYTANAEKESSKYAVDGALREAEINAESAANLLELQALYAGGDTAVFTEAQKKEVDAVVAQINSEMKEHSSNPDGKTLVSYVGGGKYLFTEPDGHDHNADGWTPQIMPIIYYSGLTDDEKAKLITQLQFNPDDVITWLKSEGLTDTMGLTDEEEE
jgi:hypothetical protein